MAQPDKVAGAATTVDDSAAPQDAPMEMPPKEKVVLNVFHEYLMTPGKMLCLSNLDRGAYRATLATLVEKKLLVAEQFRDGYSLTDAGYAAMLDCRTLGP